MSAVIEVTSCHNKHFSFAVVGSEANVTQPTRLLALARRNKHARQSWRNAPNTGGTLEPVRPPD